MFKDPFSNIRSNGHTQTECHLTTAPKLQLIPTKSSNELDIYLLLIFSSLIFTGDH